MAKNQFLLLLLLYFLKIFSHQIGHLFVEERSACEEYTFQTLNLITIIVQQTTAGCLLFNGVSYQWKHFQFWPCVCLIGF